MKKIIILVTIIVAGLFSACSEEKLGDSIFDTTERARNEFDKWLLYNYTYPYNIDFKYRMEDIETDRTYSLVPATVENSKKLARIIKFLWLEPYDEIIGIDFTRTYIPKIIHLIGSPAYNNNGTIVLGTAEAGLKVTLYDVNKLSINAASLNDMYFKTMHHEFAHILHQTKLYDPEFARISDRDYIGGNWNTRPLTDARQAGFVSQYAGNNPNEDFVETYSIFITRTPAEWSAIIASAGTAGAAIINQKFEIVVEYMRTKWGIDMYEMRDIMQRRAEELFLIDFDNL